MALRRQGRKFESIKLIRYLLRYFTYILFSVSKGRYYIGHTENIRKRLDEHNRELNKSTKYGVPWTIVFQIKFETRGEAMKLENEIKKRGAQRYLEDKGVF
jgi:putative endonuclease